MNIDVTISIHALLAESDNTADQEARKRLISIHALLAESDERADRLPNAPPQISIHALLAESDLSALAPEENPTQFLSTLSLRRATIGVLYH